MRSRKGRVTRVLTLIAGLLGGAVAALVVACLAATWIITLVVESR